MASIVCQESVLLGHVQIPNEFTVPQFTNYFKDKVQSSLSKLRHNGQTLARRNYMGKNYYGWIQKMICNNSLTFWLCSIFVLVADCAKNHVPASFPGSIGLVKDPEDSNRVVINPLYRQYGDTTNKEFNYFLSRIVQAINPTKTMYNQRKHKERISEIFLVTDEAFGLLIIYNEHHVWKSQDEAKRREPGTKETVRKRKKCCDSTS